MVLLDNLESVMDAEHEALAEQALHEALTAVLTAPAHAVTVIATTRVIPAELVKVEPGRQRQLRLMRAWAPRTPRSSCGRWMTTAISGCAMLPMTCWTGCASTPADSRGHWRQSRQSWTVITPSRRTTCSTAPANCPRTRLCRCWSGRPTSYSTGPRAR